MFKINSGGNMKLKYWITLIASLILLQASVTAAEKVKELKDGFYLQEVIVARGLFLQYFVDTKSKLCFAAQGSTGGMVIIDCHELANREEWKSIITWASK
jgi:hypothetical protein